jgi:hypothetical protein
MTIFQLINSCSLPVMQAIFHFVDEKEPSVPFDIS